MNDTYIVVTWPDSQHLMDNLDFVDHCFLINDNLGIQKFGSSAYFCEVDWLKSINWL